MRPKKERMDTKTYAVLGMHCDHCKAAVSGELEAVTGVERVDVDLETKLVTVRGETLDDAELIAAIDAAGYDAESVGV
jgi:copper chaperone